MLEQEAGLSLKVLTKIEEQGCERLRARAHVCVCVQNTASGSKSRLTTTDALRQSPPPCKKWGIWGFYPPRPF